jgi:hypothetical protein
MLPTKRKGVCILMSQNLHHLLPIVAQVAQQLLIYQFTDNIMRNLRNKPILSRQTSTGGNTILPGQPFT